MTNSGFSSLQVQCSSPYIGHTQLKELLEFHDELMLMLLVVQKLLTLFHIRDVWKNLINLSSGTQLVLPNLLHSLIFEKIAITHFLSIFPKHLVIRTPFFTFTSGNSRKNNKQLGQSAFHRSLCSLD